MVFRLLDRTAAVVSLFPYQGLQLAFFHIVPEKWRRSMLSVLTFILDELGETTVRNSV